jgi:NADPH-dependent ferric siderophore reductase
MTDHRIVRVRHELRGRLLTVARVECTTPDTIRVILTGDDLAGFVTASHDDHVKLLFPHPGQPAPVMPELGPNGATFPEGVARPAMRDYTPRRYDEAARELTIDFALHDGGPATDWARGAAPGAVLGVAGPRGSFVVSNDFAWYLLVGDETALPAIARRLEELPDTAKAFAIVAVTGVHEERALERPPGAEVVWVHRPSSRAADAQPLLEAVRRLRLPDGEGYAWIAGESGVARLLREELIARGHPAGLIRASGYWRSGTANVHESHGD